jgi:hypothetical protein
MNVHVDTLFTVYLDIELLSWNVVSEVQFDEMDNVLMMNQVDVFCVVMPCSVMVGHQRVRGEVTSS